MDQKKIVQIINKAREEGRTALLETEGMAILEIAGIRVPKYLLLPSSEKVPSDIHTKFPGEKAVVKVVSPEILHKTDVGGVAIVPNNREAIKAAVADMEKKFRNAKVAGYLVLEFVKYSQSLGRELLLGMQWTEDFGPIVNFGAGGIYAEFLAKNFKAGKDVAVLSPSLCSPTVVEKAVRKVAISDVVVGSFRNQDPLIPLRELTTIIRNFMTLAETLMPEYISEFEVNPLVLADSGPTALDALIKLSKPKARTKTQERPIHKLGNLLQPKSAAIIGVSEKMNPGHVILNNLLKEGFDKNRIYVVKPGSDSIEGCRCVPDVKSIPEKVDLFILAVAAGQVPQIITDVIATQRAESMIVIPGGLEEKKGTESIVAEMRAALAKSRESDWGGPVINGGNCLGIKSIPGKYNTLFIANHKLPMPTGKTSRLALVSQSGAFAISRTSRLSNINPRYIISIGNQMDLTIGDYLMFLKDDPEIDVFAVYVEGFRPLDGQKFLQAAEELRAKGKAVILYRAGRTSAGAQASASHTASIAGNYSVTRELCDQCGVVIADTLEEFDELVKCFAFLANAEFKGWRLGAVSNAGCECVAIADNLGKFELSHISGEGIKKIQDVFKRCGISEIVDVHNPVDLTPMANDAAYDETTRALLEDPSVDAAIVGVVPLTQALNTLPPGQNHRENLNDETAIATRLAAVKKQYQKPFVAVVDSGKVYNPLAEKLEDLEIPTFRSADRALKLMNLLFEAKLRKN